MRFGGFTGVSEGHQDLRLISGSLRAAYVLGAQREGLPHERKSVDPGSAHCRRRLQGPLSAVNSCQMSVFFANSMASSTSMPR